ncbi:MAG: hypothetical protein ACOYJ6_11735 [Caulobacterales bacterium]
MALALTMPRSVAPRTSRSDCAADLAARAHAALGGGVLGCEDWRRPYPRTRGLAVCRAPIC